MPDEKLNQNVITPLSAPDGSGNRTLKTTLRDAVYDGLMQFLHRRQADADAAHREVVSALRSIEDKLPSTPPAAPASLDSDLPRVALSPTPYSYDKKTPEDMYRPSTAPLHTRVKAAAHGVLTSEGAKGLALEMTGPLAPFIKMAQEVDAAFKLREHAALLWFKKVDDLEKHAQGEVKEGLERIKADLDTQAKRTVDDLRHTGIIPLPGTKFKGDYLTSKASRERTAALFERTAPPGWGTGKGWVNRTHVVTKPVVKAIPTLPVATIQPPKRPAVSVQPLVTKAAPQAPMPLPALKTVTPKPLLAVLHPGAQPVKDVRVQRQGPKPVLTPLPHPPLHPVATLPKVPVHQPLASDAARTVRVRGTPTAPLVMTPTVEDQRQAKRWHEELIDALKGVSHDLRHGGGSGSLGGFFGGGGGGKKRPGRWRRKIGGWLRKIPGGEKVMAWGSKVVGLGKVGGVLGRSLLLLSAGLTAFQFWKDSHLQGHARRVAVAKHAGALGGGVAGALLGGVALGPVGALLGGVIGSTLGPSVGKALVPLWEREHIGARVERAVGGLSRIGSSYLANESKVLSSMLSFALGPSSVLSRTMVVLGGWLHRLFGPGSLLETAFSGLLHIPVVHQVVQTVARHTQAATHSVMQRARQAVGTVGQTASHVWGRLTHAVESKAKATLDTMRQQHTLPAVKQSAAAYHVSPLLMTTTAALESGGNKDARSPVSSAAGLYQLIHATAKKEGVNPLDPRQAANATAKNFAANAAALHQAGIPVTNANLYLTHQWGLAGFKHLYATAQAHGRGTARDRQWMDLNGGKGMSPAQFYAYWTQRYNAQEAAIARLNHPKVAPAARTPLAHAVPPKARTTPFVREMRAMAHAQPKHEPVAPARRPTPVKTAEAKPPTTPPAERTRGAGVSVHSIPMVPQDNGLAMVNLGLL